MREWRQKPFNSQPHEIEHNLMLKDKAKYAKSVQMKTYKVYDGKQIVLSLVVKIEGV